MKQVPIYFDSVIVSSPLEAISGMDSRAGRLKVRVFTKYANRNGSYITDAVAGQLINSATQGMTPVVGFFDPESHTWASHTGPTLANAYGYVESFLGWEPFTDSDGETRDYAVFSVVLFTDYYEEAQNILGQNQSMELDPRSIQGDWADINGEEYFVYTAAKMLGFCIIGSHEPCFSVSAFFAKNDADYQSQYEKFSSLLSDLRAKIKEIENNNMGGERPMNEFENQAEENLDAETPVVEDSQIQNADAPEVFEEQPAEVVEEQPEEPAPAEEFSNEEEEVVEEVAPAEAPAECSEFEALQEQYNALNEQHEQLQIRFNESEESRQDLCKNIEQYEATIKELREKLAEYEAQEAARVAAAETAKKNELINQYEKFISNSEEIDVVRKAINDLSYDELESKLAILYAKQQMAGSDEEKVPLPEPPESQFALLMKKYRRN